MGGAIHRGILTDKFPYPIQRIPRRFFVFIHNGKLIRVQRFIRVGHITVHHVEQSVALRYNNAVAGSMSFGGKQVHAFRDFLRSVKGVVRAILVGHPHNILTLQTQCVRFFRGHVNFSVREAAQLAGMVFMLVCHQDLGDLFRLIAQIFKRSHIIGNLGADKNLRGFVHNHVRKLCRYAGINQNDFIACVNQIVLQAGTVFYVGVKFVNPVFPA